MRSRRIRQWGATIAALSVPGWVLGAGFAVQEQSVSGLGTAFAGVAAVAEDASTVYGNPAGLTRLAGRSLSAGMNVILPSADFTNEGSASAFGGDLGGTNAKASDPGFVPNVYLALPYRDNITLGFGVYAPFGLTTEYSDDWVGRYHAVKSALAIVAFNPTVAYRVNDQFSVGLGVAAYHGTVQLTSKVDLGGIVDPALSEQHDMTADFGGDDWSYGYQLGVLFAPVDHLRLGFTFRSKIPIEFEGEADFSTPADLPAALGNVVDAAFYDGTISASSDLPENINLSVAYEANERWTFLGDVAWTKWSRFSELRIEYDEAGRGDVVQPEEWENSMRYAIGARYRQNAQLTWRVGLAIEQTPIPSANLRTPRIPDNDRTWFTAGLSRAFGDRISADFSYGFVRAGDVPIDNTEESVGHTLTGAFDANVHILSAALNWHF